MAAAEMQTGYTLSQPIKDRGISHQPSLVDKKGQLYNELLQESFIGGKLACNTSLKIADNINLKLSCGYKTFGLIVDNSYKNGMFFRVGFNLC